jgi:hypothetical protein
MGFYYVIFPIMSSIVRVSHKRLSKTHTCCHHMVHISKLDILNCLTLGFNQSTLATVSLINIMKSNQPVNSCTVSLINILKTNQPINSCTVSLINIVKTNQPIYSTHGVRPNTLPNLWWGHPLWFWGDLIST